jgi:hypothetical protein
MPPHSGSICEQLNPATIAKTENVSDRWIRRQLSEYVKTIRILVESD